jgi:hypothetical protein
LYLYSVATDNSKKIWIIGGLTILAVLAVGAGVATPLLLTQSQSSAPTVQCKIDNDYTLF